ncbi:MAG: Unknown protein [uncultured Sulfurovum sp.]|uniref:SPOR domain-containing protein n=1 Tax=uncultured Sulfurovum sp. TaxID=269237 RepID=A0A6S6SVI4_9BACT|nr:MAG: Unknown protein [uncultured Sulfurovum sp.]
MIRLLLLISLVVNFSLANSEKYFIKFGSFKNLKGLEKEIERLPSTLRSHVVIVRSNAWYIPFAYYTSDKNALKSKVASYKRYFKDAHIAHSAYMLHHPLVRNYTVTKNKQTVVKRDYTPPVKYYTKSVPQYMVPPKVAVPKYQNVGISEDDNTLGYVQPTRVVSSSIVAPVPTVPIAPVSIVPPVVAPKIVTQKVVIKEVENNDIFSNIKPKKYKNFSKQMLSGQHYYLAYKKTDHNPNLLIKVSFGNHEVTYQPIIGEMKMTKASYLTDNDRLYMFADTFTKDGSFSKLDEHRENHFLVSSWANGKKLNTLRYYYKLNDAKAYLGIGTSDGLAEILSEGDYDDFFLDE